MNEADKIFFLFFFPYIVPISILLLNTPIIFPLCFSTWVVARFIHQPLLIKAGEEDKEWREFLKVEEENREYHTKFPLIKNNDKPLEEPPENILYSDTTPNGFVFIKYNKDEEGFEYSSDKSVEYKNLETIARKYVNYFNCSNIFYDRSALLKDKLDKINEAKKTIVNDIQKNINDSSNNDIDIKEKNDSVFATLKSNAPKKKKIEYVCDNANKYIRRENFKIKLKKLTNEVLNSELLKTDTTKEMQINNETNNNNSRFFSWGSWKSKKKMN